MGLSWMRVSIDVFDWNEVEDTSYSEHYVYPEQDRAVTILNEKGIKVMHTLVYWDEEIPVKLEADYSRFKTEEEIERYLDYVKFVASHFKGRIEYYELLNEPDIGKGEGDQQYVESDDYINLATRTIPVIRQEDPDAKIVVGAVSPFTEPGSRDYFFNILESDVMPLVDGVSWHFGSGSSPEYRAEYYYDYPNLIQEIKDTASANGFEGEYIAEELHWRTSESAHPSEYDEYTETAAAKYLIRGTVMVRGMDCTTGLAASNRKQVIVTQNLATAMAGAEPMDLPMEIESGATDMRSYAFSLPGGERMVALWTDGVAVDEDPGINANLTISDVTAQEVVGTDTLNDYQQNIIISNENGDLVIQDLIVRDYPLILRVK
ncbi:MAG: family 1 glycosylhydrolase [archaeon]